MFAIKIVYFFIILLLNFLLEPQNYILQTSI